MGFCLRRLLCLSPKLTFALISELFRSFIHSLLAQDYRLVDKDSRLCSFESVNQSRRTVSSIFSCGWDINFELTLAANLAAAAVWPSHSHVKSLHEELFSTFFDLLLLIYHCTVVMCSVSWCNRAECRMEVCVFEAAVRGCTHQGNSDPPSFDLTQIQNHCLIQAWDFIVDSMYLSIYQLTLSVSNETK